MDFRDMERHLFFEQVMLLLFGAVGGVCLWELVWWLCRNVQISWAT